MIYKVLAVTTLVALLSLFLAFFISEMIECGNDLGEED